MSLPTTVDEVIARMREIDAELSGDDGVAVFNRVYLTVTERIAEILARPGGNTVSFGDAVTMAELDVRFANFWLKAYDADAARRTVPPRGGRCSRHGAVDACPCSTPSRG